MTAVSNAAWLVVAALALAAEPAVADEAAAPESANAKDRDGSEHGVHFPHAFLLPMGIPDARGSYNLQLSGFREKEGGESTLDAGAHASVGMFDWGGIHLRNLGFRSSPTELIGMMALYRDRTRRQGISFIGILGLPTNPPPDETDEHGHSSGEDAERELSYLFGLTGRAVFADRATLDAILHYDVRVKHFIPELGLVTRLWGDLFSTVDTRATIGEDTAAYLLPGLKYKLLTARGRLVSGGFVGAGYQFPVTGTAAFDSQVYIQLELGRHR